MSKRQKIEIVTKDICKNLQQRKKNICRWRKTILMFENFNKRFRETKMKTRKTRKTFSIDVNAEKLIIDKNDNKFSIVNVIIAIVDANDNIDVTNAVIIC